MRRWRSGLSHLAVNQATFGLRGFESLSTHHTKTTTFRRRCFVFSSGAHGAVNVTPRSRSCAILHALPGSKKSMVSKREIVIGAAALVIGLGIGMMGGSEIERGRDYKQHAKEGKGGDMMMDHMGHDMDGMAGHGDMSMDAMMESMMQNMRGKSGEALEKAFLDDMIAHHAGAVEMAALLKQGTKRQELIDFSNAIIDVQTKEIEQMREWRKTWYTPERM